MAVPNATELIYQQRVKRYAKLPGYSVSFLRDQMEELLTRPDKSISPSEKAVIVQALKTLGRGAYAEKKATFSSSDGVQPFAVTVRRREQAVVNTEAKAVLNHALDLAARQRIPVCLPERLKGAVEPYTSLPDIIASGFADTITSKRGKPSAFEPYRPSIAVMLQKLNTSKEYPEWGIGLPTHLAKRWGIWGNHLGTVIQEFVMAADDSSFDDFVLFMLSQKNGRWNIEVDHAEWNTDYLGEANNPLHLHSPSLYKPILALEYKGEQPFVRMPKQISKLEPIEERFLADAPAPRPVFRVLTDMNGNLFLSRLLPVSPRVLSDSSSLLLQNRAKHLGVFEDDDWLGIPLSIVPQRYRATPPEILVETSIDTLLSGILDEIESHHLVRFRHN